MPDTPVAATKPDEKPATPEKTPGAKTETAKKAVKAKKASKAKARKARRRPAKKAAAPRPRKPSPKAGRGGTLDVLALRKKLGLSRAALGKLLGVHENSISNWELRGTKITEKNAAKLREIAGQAASGKLATEKPKKAAAPRKAAVAPRKASTPSKNGKGPTASIDVAAIRAKLGISRVGFAKLVGAVPESVRLWESGRPASEKFVAKLRELAAQGAKAPAPASVRTAMAPRRGRPPGRPARSTEVVGEAPVVYADVMSVVRSGETARIKFGIIVPGEKGARAVADLVVPSAILGTVGV